MSSISSSAAMGTAVRSMSVDHRVPPCSDGTSRSIADYRIDPVAHVQGLGGRGSGGAHCCSRRAAGT